MYDIIAKIENVKDNNSLRISETDKAYCELLQRYFQEVLANLDKWEAFSRACLETDFKDRYELRTTRWNETCYDNKAEEEHMLLAQMFFPGDVLSDLENNRRNAVRQFVTIILGHFNDQYGLGLSIRDMEKPEEVKSYHEVIDWLFTQLEGSSLEVHNIQLLKKNFRDTVLPFYKNTASLDKSKVEFSSIRNLFEYNQGNYWLNSSDTQFCSFMYGLGYFETGRLKHIPASTMQDADMVKYNHKYLFENSEKLASVKFYKSGKAILNFQSEHHALAFYGSFGLD